MSQCDMIYVSLLNRFCRHADENKRQKVALILDKLITMTIDEVEVNIQSLLTIFLVID